VHLIDFMMSAGDAMLLRITDWVLRHQVSNTHGSIGTKAEHTCFTFVPRLGLSLRVTSD
jgi:hypothetical protein